MDFRTPPPPPSSTDATASSCCNYPIGFGLPATRPDLQSEASFVVRFWDVTLVGAVMDRWGGVLKVPVCLNKQVYCRVAVSLCISSISRRLMVPSANAIFFNGDRVEGSGNPVIERLSDIKKIAEVLVSKFVGTINVWVVEAPQFNGPFAVYKEFIPALNCCGEPKAYTPCGFLASVSTFSLLSNCLKEAKNAIAELQEKEYAAMPSTSDVGSPTTFVLGFSKGGIVLNQLLTELSYSEVITHGISPQTREESLGSENLDTKEDDGIIPNSKESLLNSITEIHYVDVGLNSAGAYLTDTNVFKRISRRLAEGAPGIRFVLHGTPRQWCDKRRAWIQKEKNKLVELLQSEAHGSGGKLRVSEKYYFPDRPPTLQMHFEIINDLDVS